ncbi:hypothetical protein D1BOALGB6SA_4007 [Olavius sp. associated proteobacterium Delta 1]|nr:hypothetical protein D1BOALGB6SA_4007 [Olavius sp. associated proteobacterium Delta 1]
MANLVPVGSILLRRTLPYQIESTASLGQVFILIISIIAVQNNLKIKYCL